MTDLMEIISNPAFVAGAGVGFALGLAFAVVALAELNAANRRFREHVKDMAALNATFPPLGVDEQKLEVVK